MRPFMAGTTQVSASSTCAWNRLCPCLAASHRQKAKQNCSQDKLIYSYNSLALERTASAWEWLMSHAPGHWGLYASAKKEERNLYAACNMFVISSLTFVDTFCSSLNFIRGTLP